MFDTFVKPEIQRRHELGLIPALPMPLRAVQILFALDGPAEVRLNDEVKTLGQVIVKPEIAIPGTDISFHDIVAFEGFMPSEPEDANKGHMTAMWTGKGWLLAYDFRRNKQIGAELMRVSRQFLEAARSAIEAKSWSVVAESLFSALELAVKAYLWTSPWGKNLRPKMPHTMIRSEFSKFPIAINGMQSTQETLEALAAERGTARYLHGPIVEDWDKAALWFSEAEKMVQRAEAQVGLAIVERSDNASAEN